MQPFLIPRYANLKCNRLGLDSYDHVGKRFFDHEPVTYNFNANGFRTHEFNELNSECIVVFGDSCTLGLGENVQNRFTDIMQDILQHKVFNISLNGASNDWIARRVQDLLKYITPKALVIHYTFSHRRESSNIEWNDDERTLCSPEHSDDENFYNWLHNFRIITDISKNIPIVHSFIPNWHPITVD